MVEDEREEHDERPGIFWDGARPGRVFPNSHDVNFTSRDLLRVFSVQSANYHRGGGEGRFLVGSVPHTIFCPLLPWPPSSGFRSSCVSSWASSLPLVLKPFVPLNPIVLPAQREYPGGLAKPHRTQTYLPASPRSASQRLLVYLPAPTDGGATPLTSTPS
jgi:hypothetical protein